ncbi:hypothetical protein LUW75_11005 [Streptomyces sp. MRC013]|uniref:hypothetical protein n=1 Tax=Streptomyces sp. MRC013 TaxID=2898276 RepID=UPI002026BCE4|nr:hypothetical protein [Streptomyces sp. MRC013]URM90158.1 hypothetical protein LUW75_09350 [Streptomyces sp. MRC013]URM90439.1 hypothetical protein LUW75_11005 [Streptomyces sp. MRC013]
MKEHRGLPVPHRFADGSYLSARGPLTARVIDCEITVSTARGRRTGAYRLVATPTDAHPHPATEPVKPCHERWEAETSYPEIESTILGGRIPRARTPAGMAREAFALLVTHQVLRLARADATATHADPDRAGFTIALHAARDLLVQAAGIIDTTIDPIDTIGRRVLARLTPTRRIRTRPRVVKPAISRYNAEGLVDRTSYKATISIDIPTGRTT